MASSVPTLGMLYPLSLALNAPARFERDGQPQLAARTREQQGAQLRRELEEVGLQSGP